MKKQRRTFSPEFKQQAACLVLEQGYSHMEASRSVGVGETVLRRWVHQLQQEREGITPQGKAITPDQQGSCSPWRLESVQGGVSGCEGLGAGEAA